MPTFLIVFLPLIYEPVSPVRVNSFHRITPTVRIRTNAIALLAERIHPVPACGDGVVLPCSVVVGVQPVHRLQFLAVVLVTLQGGIHHCRRVGVGCAEGVVVRHLQHPAVGIHHLADVAQVVAVVVVEREAVCRVAHARRLRVAPVEEYHVRQVVLHREHAPEQVVAVGDAHYLPVGGPRRLHAEFPRDVRHSDVVPDAQLLARRAVGVPYLVAVHEVYRLGVAVQVVCDVCDAPAPVGHQGAVGVVDILRAVLPLVLERAVGVVVRCRLRHARQPVAVVGHGEVVHHPVAVGRGLPVAGDGGDVAVCVVLHVLPEPAGTRYVVALAVHGLGHPARRVVGELVAPLGVVLVAPPPDGADAAVPAGRAGAAGIEQLLGETAGGDARQPPVKVVCVGDVPDRCRAAGARQPAQCVVSIVEHGGRRRHAVGDGERVGCRPVGTVVGVGVVNGRRARAALRAHGLHVHGPARV